MSSEGTSSLIKTLRCSTCGAPLQPSAESILTICNFCGSVTAQSPIDPHIIIQPKPLTPPEGLGTIRKMELILIPFFEVVADVNVEALGYQRRQRTETKTVGHGENRRTVTKTIVEYRPWRFAHQGTHAVRFLARQEVTLFGASEFEAAVASDLCGDAVPFSSDYVKRLVDQHSSEEFIALSPEWDQNEAAKKAGELVYETAYARAKSEMHEVFDTKVKFTPKAIPRLIHEPLLLVRRNYQGRSYRSAYHWGNGKLLREEQPIKNRALMVFFTLLFFLGIPPMVQIAFNIYNTSEEVWALIVFGILSLVLFIAGIVLMVRVYKPHKIKSSGGSISLFSFQRVSVPQQKPGMKKPRPPAAKQQPTAKFCTKCGDPLEPSQRFCEKCGHDMRS